MFADALGATRAPPKASSACFNGEKLERKTEVSPCLCTDEDYECDFGYERQNIQMDSRLRNVLPDSCLCCMFLLGRGHCAKNSVDADFLIAHVPEKQTRHAAGVH